MIIIISNEVSPFKSKKPYQFRPLSSPLSSFKELTIKEIDGRDENHHVYLKLKVVSSLLFSGKNAIQCIAIDKDDDLSFIIFANLERSFDRDYVEKLFKKGTNLIILNPHIVGNDKILVVDPNDIIHDEKLPLTDEEINKMTSRLSSSPDGSTTASSKTPSPSSFSSPSSSASSTPQKRVFCTSNGCNKNDATFLCPKCKQLGITSYFCSQACFKANYNSHKSVHKKKGL